MTLNTKIDETYDYRRAIDGINGLTDNWNNLLDYFAQNSKVSGFLQEQVEEEQKKAQIILQNKDVAEVIYKAEKHPYFSGQIRSALYYAIDEKPDMEIFKKYWNKISALFDDTKPKNGHLLRRALLVFGDYTLPVAEYRTLCVDEPNEKSSTPGMKRLFSSRSINVKQLLDELDLNNSIEEQLKKGVEVTFEGGLGTWADRYLLINQLYVRFKEGKFVVTNTTNTVLFETLSETFFQTSTDDPLAKVSEYLLKMP